MPVAVCATAAAARAWGAQRRAKAQRRCRESVARQRRPPRSGNYAQQAAASRLKLCLARGAARGAGRTLLKKRHVIRAAWNIYAASAKHRSVQLGHRPQLQEQARVPAVGELKLVLDHAAVRERVELDEDLRARWDACKPQRARTSDSSVSTEPPTPTISLRQVDTDAGCAWPATGWVMYPAKSSESVEMHSATPWRV